MLVLVHLSDIHFTAVDNGLASRNASLRVDVLNDIRTMRKLLGDADAILVSGDIAYSGLPAEYQAARGWLDEVAEASGTAPSAVQVVPGNHDVHRGSVTAAGTFIRNEMRGADPAACDAVIDSLLEEDADTLLRPLRSYNEFAAEYRCEIGRDPYWQSDDIDLGGGFSLAIRGITTVLSSDHRDKRPNLVVGRTQSLLQKDRPGRAYLVMGHHPPDWWHDHDAVLGVLRGRCSILLCGHKHVQHIERVDEMLRITAGAVHPEEDPGWQPRYNWMTLETDLSNPDDPRLVVQVWSRVFRDNEFGADYQLGGSDYVEHRLKLMPVAPTGTDAGAGMSPDVASTDGTDDAELPASVARPPVIEPGGDAVTERDVYRSFLRLPYTRQMKILQELALLEDDDLDRSHVELVGAALRRATDRREVASVAAAVEAAQNQQA